MINLVLTILPVVLTFSVAAWSSPTNEAQPRSDASLRDCPAPCRA